jgi:hypothetical protein
MHQQQEESMADFFSSRFGKNVWLTKHAREAMQDRKVEREALFALIEQGHVATANTDDHMWIYGAIEGRSDNMVCAAVVVQSAIVVKTVMVGWRLEA